MDDKNELSDIVLNKSSSSNSNKKIILAIATLGVILIVGVMLMNSISSKGTNNLPQAVLPPEPKTQASTDAKLDKEPLFEEVKVVQENAPANENLDNIAKKLKQESNTVTQEVVAPIVEEKPRTVVKQKPVFKKVPKKTVKKVTRHYVTYFIQVGSFSKYTPNKKFLKSITKLGYKYSYHKVHSINKVLVGPFNSLKEANSAKQILRSKIEPGAFLVKL